jgi:glycogen operon protein
MDSLRYWILEMHVDGFRFDLASALARELHAVDRLGAFFDIIRQDPVISQVKLIAEPWDLGEGGYQVGGFPAGWAEWNGRYRDAARAYWRGEGGLIGEMGYRLTGSSDLYGHSGRRPHASINFVTSHDGFTLADLVTYEQKHNEANLENNQDGDNHNLSWNCGVEGPSADPEIEALRARQQRNLLATLLLSQGIPMLPAGDEFGRTQQGNNNAYCQDNEISWLDWALDEPRRELLEFVRRLAALRKAHPTFRRQHFFEGRAIHGAGLSDIVWYDPSGAEMSEEQWRAHHARCLGMYFDGSAIAEQDRWGRRVKDDDFLIMLNASAAELQFRLPLPHPQARWSLVLDTARIPQFPPNEGERLGAVVYPLDARSVVVLVSPPREG